MTRLETYSYVKEITEVSGILKNKSIDNSILDNPPKKFEYIVGETGTPLVNNLGNKLRERGITAKFGYSYGGRYQTKVIFEDALFNLKQAELHDIPLEPHHLYARDRMIEYLKTLDTL